MKYKLPLLICINIFIVDTHLLAVDSQCLSDNYNRSIATTDYCKAMAKGEAGAWAWLEYDQFGRGQREYKKAYQICNDKTVSSGWAKTDYGRFTMNACLNEFGYSL
jgi:hypothetical protein